ncbi:MAG: copper amine oxidase N-terminal domain-containing protein [Clostridiales bacterium]|jgi:hypothetical protein|nr:copper amine oxidase N-terminal domain-containing protein [Clostridiales bacterium]
MYSASLILKRFIAILLTIILITLAFQFINPAVICAKTSQIIPSITMDMPNLNLSCVVYNSTQSKAEVDVKIIRIADGDVIDSCETIIPAGDFLDFSHKFTEQERGWRYTALVEWAGGSYDYEVYIAKEKSTVVEVILPSAIELPYIDLGLMPSMLPARVDEETAAGNFAGEVGVKWHGYSRLDSKNYMFVGYLKPSNEQLISDKLDTKLEVWVHRTPEDITESNDEATGDNGDKQSIVVDDDNPKASPSPKPSPSPSGAHTNPKASENVEPKKTPRDINTLTFAPGDLVLNGTDSGGLNFDIALDTPIIYNERKDRLLFPVRFFAEELGYEVEWRAETNTVVMSNATTRLILQINSTDMVKNGKATEMDAAPIICNARTYVPIRYVAEGFGYTVMWNNASQTAMFVKSKV